MWGARAGSGGDRLGSVELMRTAQRRLGQAGRRPFGPEPGSDPGAVWPPTWAGRAGSCGPSPGGSGPNSWLSPQRPDQANYRAVASLAIKGWMNRPGTREAPSSGLVSPSLPLRGWCWPRPPGLTSDAHTQFYTLQLTPSHITSQPRDPTQSIKLPAQGRGRGRRPKGASERGAGALFTQLARGAAQAPRKGPPCPTPRAGMLTHTPSPLPHTFGCVSNTLQSRTHTLHKRGAHTGMSHHLTRGGEVRRHPTPRRVTRVAHRGLATHR